MVDEAAADQFIAAANAFRMQKMGKRFKPSNTPTFQNKSLSSGHVLMYGLGKEAGEAFEKAAQVQKQNLNEPDDEANTLTEAFSTLQP